MSWGMSSWLPVVPADRVTVAFIVNSLPAIRQKTMIALCHCQGSFLFCLWNSDLILRVKYD